jgi:hypothetical protein
MFSADLALRLPLIREPLRRTRPRIAWCDSFAIWTFCMGLALDGIFVFGLSLLAASGVGNEGIIAAGTAMALRYASEFVLSPIGRGLPWPRSRACSGKTGRVARHRCRRWSAGGRFCFPRLASQGGLRRYRADAAAASVALTAMTGAGSGPNKARSTMVAATPIQRDGPETPISAKLAAHRSDKMVRVWCAP